ncbi:HTH-type transcriptional regulator YofA [Anaerotruncus sp. 2789STDY5834896]|uniref:HTH-type transcriptional regulator YofA n=1 Tax=uncultured Anaerotruncus sp. TaxID=905011 RepID=A0A1C6IBD5_9FIRM|nr:HTH-type transcriptional regulator YofA [uncultured Anaerotruncus sp.]
MELKYLYTFKTILDAGSFQKAAERLHYAQSTVTLQMQLLSQSLSTALFEKIGRKMVLTQSGRELLPYIEEVLAAAERLQQYSQHGRQLTGTLRIALPETLLSYQMSPVLAAFRRAAPAVKLSLQTPNCYEIRRQLINGAVDIGIHYDIGGYGPSLVTQKLGSYPLVLVGSPALHQQEQDFVTPGQQKDLCLLTADKNSLYQQMFDAYLRTAAITLNGEIEILSTEAIKRSVSGNIGVSYLPRFTVEEELRQGTLRALPAAVPRPEVATVCTYHKNKWVTPAMELFICLLKEQLCTT